ncbi:HNH endonuclease [Cryobacterium glaciale]|uniref:HNH endonuclease n=1 Tax=Cryobacterium glaciale TaxID=1259145 RepID=A0A4V3I8K9_9MICO|nr:HNH endonuclease signature motif containing protein [Cryobacterium glaciale]TFB75347.1 HNH endonuclease [Cryobacterium glaciale]
MKEALAPMFMENPGSTGSNAAIVAVEQARDLLLAALGGVSFGLLGDEESLTMLLALESVGRVVDGARVLSTTDVLRRSEYFDASAAKNAAAQAAAVQTAAVQTAAVQTVAAEVAGAESGRTESGSTESVIPEGATPSAAALAAPTLARRLGCRSGVDLVCTLGRLSRAEVRQRAALGEKAGERMLLGRPLTPTYPVLGEALQGGAVGVEQARVIVKVLDGLRSSVLIEDLDRVERSLVASGSGAITPETEGLPGAGIAFAPELLRQQGIQWQARLAPDGTAPGETPAERRSWLTFGNLSNGGYSLNGWFTTLDRAIIGNVFDAYLSAAAANPVPGASTPGTTPAPASTTPVSGTSGTAPRATVEFRETEPTNAEQAASDEVDEQNDVYANDNQEAAAPLTTQQVDELICAGGYQPILFGHTGKILNLGTTSRFFTASQRRALAARDGGCVIPGCTVPPHYTQAHHVIPWHKGGPTDIGNAALLCNAGHASIDTSGWDIDMRDGRPWIRGPLLYDPTQTWRPASHNRAATPTEQPNWEK